MGFSRQEVGWVEEARTERDRRVRQLPPDKLGTRRSAARGPWAAPGGREHLEKPGCAAAA